MKNTNIREEAKKKLDDRDYITTIDKERLIELIERFPEQMEYISETMNDKILEKTNKYTTIGVVGVGTTKVCAEILESLLNLKGTLPAFPLNDCSLPNWVGKLTLLIFVSFSGNTQEVISCFKQSIKRGCPSVVITTGGRLEREALTHKIPLVKIRKEKPPNRTVLPYMVVPVLMICAQIGLLPLIPEHFKNTAQFLKKWRSSFTVDNHMENNPAKEIALQCLGTIPLIYIENALYTGVARRWQYQFNENAKVLAYSSKLPEMSHNEIIGLHGGGMSSLVTPLFLTHNEEDAIISERLRFTQTIIKEKGYSVMKVPLIGDSELERIFYGIYLGDYVSYYLAVLRDVDPHAVDLIDKIRLPETK